MMIIRSASILGACGFHVRVFLLLAGIFLFLPETSRAEDPIVLGIHPYQPEDVLSRAFSPLAEYLQEVIGRPVVIRIGTNYEEHIQAIGNDRVDLAFLGPAGYVSMVQLFEERSIFGKIVTHGKPFFRGHIIVAKSSPLKSLQELAGQRLAFVDLYSTMYLVPHAMLQQAGLTREEISQQSFLGSHHNVALGILAGDYAAGGVKEEVFKQFESQGLRSLASTLDIPEHIFVASHRLDPSLLDPIREALFTLDSTEEGRNILHSIKPSVTGIIAAEDSDYEDLRQLLKYLEEGKH